MRSKVQIEIVSTIKNYVNSSLKIRICSWFFTAHTNCYIFFAKYLALHSTFYYLCIINSSRNCFKRYRQMDLENAQVQMRKGILEYCILHIISRGEIYASEILDELINARIMVVEGTLYPLLTRLKNSGLLDYKWVESTSGPPRKYYVLTETGKLFLDNLNSTWNELSESVTTIINKKTK
jgi:PadR family transcriptional regulator PadR